MSCGQDGLILQDDAGRRGTFLPKVWDSVADAAEFLALLRGKAGLEGKARWDGCRLWRYSTESFSGSVAALYDNVLSPPAGRA